MAIGSRGYYFTLTTLLMLGVLAIYLASVTPYQTQSSQLSQQRIEEINTFISTVKADASTALYVSSYRSLLVVEEEMLKKQGYLTDVDQTLTELITAGTLDGQPQKLLETSSLEDWEANVLAVASQLRVVMNITTQGVVVSQHDPWFLTVTLQADLRVVDSLTAARWDLPLRATADISLNSLYDPLYTVQSRQRYFQRIKPATESLQSVGDLLLNHSYVASDRSPSYLGRLTGDLTASPQGIESLVDVPALAEVDIINEGSIIDWHYLSQVVPTTCHVPGQPSWVLISPDRAGDYGAVC